MADPRRGSSIGELYGKITVPSGDFEAGERRLVKEPDPSFVALCKRLYALSPSLGAGGVFTEENRRAVDFLKWRLSPGEFSGASKVVTVLLLLAAFALGSLLVFTPLSGVLTLFTADTVTLYVLAYAPAFAAALGVVNYFQSFPSAEARREQTKALTYVPEMLGYMVMSIKLVPNLEKAVEFAAGHGKGKIAKDLKDLLWQVQIGVYNSLSEGLDALAYSWGRYSEEFKRALMRVRASVIENTEAKRYALLDQTMVEMLDSIRAKMERYARDLSQPSTMLFYIGVLLPLLLIIILPVGSSFSGAPLANPVVLFIVYDAVIPGITIWFAYNLLQSRPPTYETPVIPDDYPSLPPKWKATIGGLRLDVRYAAALIAILGVSFSFVVSTQGLPPKFLFENGQKNPDGTPLVMPCSDKRLLVPCDLSAAEALSRSGRPVTYFALDQTGQRYTELYRQAVQQSGSGAGQLDEQGTDAVKQQVLSEQQLFFSQSANDIAPYKLVFGTLISLSVALFVLLYYSSIYKRRAQLEVQEMESEFRDSLYVIASRMGENKPVEDALRHVTEFLPEARISRTVFAKTLDNINLLGMPLEQAVFDQNAGSVARIPSDIIRGSMKMLVDSVQLGVNVAARTMISLSIQLQNAEKVNTTLRTLVADVTGTMKTMTLFVAPIVLGITTSLQRIVIVTISSIAASSIGQSVSSSGAALPGSFSQIASSGFISPKAIANIASPTQFILIVALYIVELVLIMTYFTTKIEEDNDLLVKINIGTFMPVAVTMFVLSMVVSNLVVGSI